MAVDKYVSCDVCGVRIVRLLESESLEDEVIAEGGCPASLHPEGLDLCSTHTQEDNRAIRAVFVAKGGCAAVPV